jgi:hypothetical protein
LTVGDLVVILLILSLVIGIGLMVIPWLRESAHRLQCANNLKQLGEAMRRFSDVKGFLPAARIAERHATWAVQVAPYLSGTGQNPLSTWDLQKSFYSQTEAARQVQLSVFSCPSRRLPQLSVHGDVPADGQPAARHFAGAVGDYACVSGDGSPQHPWQTAEANGAIIPAEVLDRSGEIILRWRSRIDLASLKRGQSHTMLVGEKHVPRDHIGDAQFGDGSLYNGDNPASFARIGGPGYGLAASPEVPFNVNLGSYHLGICQVLLADGSARVLTNPVNEQVLGQLATRGE